MTSEFYLHKCPKCDQPFSIADSQISYCCYRGLHKQCIEKMNTICPYCEKFIMDSMPHTIYVELPLSYLKRLPSVILKNCSSGTTTSF